MEIMGYTWGLMRVSSFGVFREKFVFVFFFFCSQLFLFTEILPIFSFFIVEMPTCC